MPLDYDGLKKQRFRWAFGGMQILRMHIRKLIPTWMGGDSESRLTWPQKFAYLSGGLQWLNDPLNFIFTALLLTGVGALVSGGSLIIQPMVGFVVIMPATFVLFGLLRFLWALRIRLRCSWIEAYRALTILLGLIWVVTLACVQGLTRRQGVFLRTPKKKGDAGLISGFRIVRWELGLSAICACGMGALILGDVPKIPRLFLIALSGWQSFIYSSAVQSWLWSYQSEKLKGPQLMPIPFRTAGHLVGRFVGESISAVHVVLGLVLFGILLWVSAIKATEMERIFSILPDYSYLTKLTKHPAPIEIKAIIYQEGDAALKADVDQAVSLWSQDGFIHDMNFTPDNPLDDRIWKGKKAIRERYKEEFTLRSYLRLAHQNISVVIDGDKANAQNDLMAVIKTERDIEQVLLQRSDKWSFRKDRSEWKILSLTVNRIEIKPK